MPAKLGHLVYSTATPAACPRCGWPTRDCRCGEARDEPVPARVVAVLRLETSGRGGKSVTVVDGLPANRAFLAQLAADLKRACGTGGTTGATHIELQGDRRDAVRSLLVAKGWTVKG